MSAETLTETETLSQPRRNVLRRAAASIHIHRARSQLCCWPLAVGWYFYSQGYEDTDDAQVDGHLNPIASRIDGTINAVHVDDNQAVKTGALLVELDPGDDRVALQQAQAQYDQAMAQLGAAHPNLPITRISNLNDITSQQAEVSAQKLHSPPRSMTWTAPWPS